MLQGQGFSWGQVIGYGLKLAFAALGGTGNNIEHDGVDKIGVEGGASPAQVNNYLYLQITVISVENIEID
jgi:hypothetical protein